MFDDDSQRETAWRDALRVNPLNFDACYGLAMLHHRRGDHEAAVALLQKAQLIKPGNTDAHVALGQVLIDTGQFHAAQESLRASARAEAPANAAKPRQV